MAVVISKCLLVDAASADSARRLIAELHGVRAEVAPGDGASCVVAIELEGKNDGWLDRVLDGLQRWLVDSALPVCCVHLDGRSYVVERAAP